MKAIERTVTIVNVRGLHARAAAKFARLAEAHAAGVTVAKDGEEAAVCGRSIMDLLMLAAGQGAAIRIRAEGEGAEAAVEELAGLVESRFGEEI